MRGFYPARWEAGALGTQVDILVADDFLIEESHRNQGLGTLLMQHALDDLAARGERWVLNLSGGVITVLGSLAMGWRSAGPLGPIGQIAPWHARLEALRNRMAGLPYLWRFADSPTVRTRLERSPFRLLDQRIGRVHMVDGDQITIEAEPRPLAMARLIERLPYDGRIRHLRDTTYLGWRYRNPRNQYRFLYAGDDPLRGYLALAWTPHSMRPDSRVSIVDWEAEDKRCLESLLDAAVNIGHFPHLRTWSAATTGGDLLQARGFVPVDQHLTRHGCPCVLVRSCDSSQPPEDWQIEGRSLLGLEHWDMRMVYTMAG